MPNMRNILKIIGVLVLVATLSSFTVLAEEDSLKSKDNSSENAAASSEENNSSEEQSKEKRSREEIFSGNQQDGPNGLVDDLMNMNENEMPEDKLSDTQQGGIERPKEVAGNKESAQPEDYSSDMVQESDNWYDAPPAALPVSASALQYLSSAPGLHSLPSQGYGGRLYDQEDVYRRKRQLLKSSIPLRRRRSLRNSLGEMIQQRGLRMPRRSMRLKRQANIYSLLGNDAFYDDQTQVPPQSYDGWDSKMRKRHVPGHYTTYPETTTSELQYPFTFRHRNGGLLSDVNDYKEDIEQEPTYDDVDSLMLMHPHARYVEDPDLPASPYRTRDEEKEAFQKWLARYTIPNTVEVSRRSTPFYPLDYRFMPGYKKRNIFRHGNRNPQHFSGDMDDLEPEMGTWGRVIQVPEAYASPEDVARLYGLASLMSEGDDEVRTKRNI